MKMSKLLHPLVVFLALYLELAAASHNTDADRSTVRLLGLFGIYHRGSSTEEPCGSLKVTDVQLVESMVLAIDLINNDSSLLPNVTLVFQTRGTCESEREGLLESVFPVLSPVLPVDISGVVGPALSTVSEATANFFGIFRIPQISYASTAASLSDSRFDYFFRTVPPDSYQARALADLVAHFNWTYIIALHSNDIYGRDGIREFTKAFDTNATRRCTAITIELGGEVGYEEAANRMSRDWVRNASVAVLIGHVENLVGMLTVIRETHQDLQNITWIVGTDFGDDDLPAEFHSTARGMLSVTPQTEPIQAFDDYFVSLNPQDHPNPWFRLYWEELFNCSLDMSSCLVEDCDLNNQTVCENITGYSQSCCDLNNQTISESTTGYSQFSQVPLVFDAVYAFAHSLQDLIDDRCPDGDLCSDIVYDFGGFFHVEGELLRDYLLNVSFLSPSQKWISFDENGDVPAAYAVLNLKRVSNGDVYSFEKVGTWNVSNLLSLTGEIEFTEGDDTVPESVCSSPCGEGYHSRLVPDLPECCFTCELCPENAYGAGDQCITCDLGHRPNLNGTAGCVMIPVTHSSWSHPWAIAILILTCVGIVATTFVIAVFLVHYKHELIKASSRELSAILLAGIFLCYILPFFYIARPSAAVCAIRRFGVGFCFAVSYSALLVKTNRIHRIFNRNINTPAKKIRFISPLSQVLITSALIGVQVLIAVIWLAVEPPGTRIISSLSQNELICSESPYIGLSVSFSYNFLLLVLCTYFAFLTRKVPENFNEAKYINITVYSILVTWIAFVPTYFATIGLGTVFQTGSLAFGIILSASTTLCCLFMTKIYLLFSRIQEKKQETTGTHITTTGTHIITTDLKTI